MDQQDAINKLYRIAAKAAHPDAGGSNELMIEVQKAAEILRKNATTTTGWDDVLAWQAAQHESKTADDLKRESAKQSEWWTHPIRNCRECAAPFRPARQDARYCSSRCRNFAWRKHHPTKRKYFRPLHPVCVICGGAFEARRKTAQYCSAACAQASYRRRKAATNG